MKKLIFSLFVILSITKISYPQANNYNWIIPNKSYLKVLITEDGIYRINKQDFRNARVDASSIDPRTIKIIYKGNQIPVFFQGEKDKIFNDTDYFDFYAVRNYGGLAKVYNENLQYQYSIDEYNNQYSDNNVYWIDWGGSFGQRITEVNYNYPFDPNPFSYFDCKIHFEKDLLFSRGEQVGGSDFRCVITEKFKGEGFYRALLSNSSNTLTDTFTTSLLYNAQNGTVRVAGYPLNVSSSITNEHKIRVYINNLIIDTIRVNDFKRFDTTLTFPGSNLSNSSVNSVKLIYVPASGFDGYVYIDFTEIKYGKLFKYGNDAKVSIVSGGPDTSLRLFSIANFNVYRALQNNIYDISKNLKLTGYSNYPDTMNFLGKSDSKFEIVNKFSIKKPKKIYLREVPNLLTNTTGTDYLLIYNKTFGTQAEQLRSYRESHDNFRAYKSEIEDIYDVFNYGIENPSAVRNFIKKVYDSWQAPKVEYVCLFGRGSLDPKGTLSISNNYTNYIPAYGFPPSDGYFVNMNMGTFFYYDQIAIGRLPAYTVNEAQNMVDNIVAYENQSPSDWWKNYVFIAGGGSLAEQKENQASSNYIINTYINQNPLRGNVFKIYRSDTSGTQTYSFSDSIRKGIDKGAAIVNFTGHAGSRDWEIGMSEPSVLNNTGKLPLILSITCYTGQHSETYIRGFGERFITMNNKGAVGFIGTTGWSFVAGGDELSSWMYYTIRNDTNRRIGNIIKSAKKRMSIDSVYFTTQHTVNCYSLLGDPACKLALPKQPEFSIDNKSCKFSNDFASIGEAVSLIIYPKNYGLNADSCKIRFQLKKNNLNHSYSDTILRNIKYTDSAKYYFLLDSSGNYSIDVNLDYENWYPLENKSNNNITINLSIKNNSAIPLLPVNNSVVCTDSVEFKILSPFVKNSQNSVKCILQYDTVRTFSSPLARMFINNNVTEVSSNFKCAVPILDSSVIYFWRTNAIVNGDSTGWSQALMFSYNPTDSYSLNSKYEDSSDSGSIQILKFRSSQFNDQDLSNTAYNNNGVKLNEFTGNIVVNSFGSNGPEASYFSINNKNIYIDGGGNTGLNMLKVKKINGNILQFRNFKMTYMNSSDSVLSFLNSFDSTHYLLALNASFVETSPYYLFNAATKSKIRQFGSTHSDTVRKFGWFDTWAFIGFLNALPGQVAESFNRLNVVWTPSVCSLSPVFRKTTGTASNIIGPAQSWKDFSWRHTIMPLSSILFDVTGIDKSGARTVLFSNQSSYQFINLDTINSFQYPKLDLLAKFLIDTINGNQSSILNSLKAEYVPPAELILNLNSFRQSDSVSESGKELKIYFDYYNVGCENLPGVIVNIYKSDISSQNILNSDTISSQLKKDSSGKYSGKFTIPHIKSIGGTKNKLKFFVEIIPKGMFNEFYTYNNFMSFDLNIMSRSKSNVELYSNGVLLKNGDFVSKNPEIELHYIKANPLYCSLADSSKNDFSMQSKSLLREKSEKSNKTFDNIKKAGDDLLIQSFHPKFNPGENKFRIIYADETGETDTLDYALIVSDEFGVKDLCNYPNPMKNETSFIFNLTGPEFSYPGVIRIYTISGRIIKKINFYGENGTNQVHWDGKDDDGDYVSNGTYLYKMIFEGEIDEGLPVGKLAILK